MAITSGVRPVRVWLVVDGQRFPCIDGSAEQPKTKKSASFSAHLAMSYPGVLDALKEIGENSTQLVIQSGSGEKTLVDGEIDTTDFDLIGRTVSVRGRCKSAKLHANKSAEKFNNKKPDEIVKDLAGRVGLKVDASASTLLAGKTWQIDFAKLADNISYGAIIHKLADMEGARWWVKEGTLFFKSDDDDASAYVITYSAPENRPVTADFLQMSVSRNVQAGKTGKIVVKSWNQKKKKAFVSTAVIGGAGGTVNYGYHIPGLSQEHADKHAKSKAKEHGHHELTVSISMVGDPDIDVAQKLRLRGTPFDQDFEMTSISHSVGPSGHTMRISAKSAKTGREATVEGSGDAASTAKANAGKTASTTPGLTKAPPNVDAGKPVASTIG